MLNQVASFFEVWLPLIVGVGLLVYVAWTLVFSPVKKVLVNAGCVKCRILRLQFVECRDALACAINWLYQEDQPRLEPPPAVAEWLSRHNLKATIIADAVVAGTCDEAHGVEPESEHVTALIDCREALAEAISWLHQETNEYEIVRKLRLRLSDTDDVLRRRGP